VRVAGLDLSLSSSGVVVIDTEAVEPFALHRIQTAPARATATISERADRLRVIRNRVMAALGRNPPGTRGLNYFPDLVMVEAPAIQGMMGAHDMSGSWWSVIDVVDSFGIPVVEVINTKVKKYATGSGSNRGATKVTKAMVVAAVRERYGDAVSQLRSNDVADALILAAMGCRLADHPIETHMPAANLAAMDGLHLPEGWNPE
jgi:crossover junction endodeoxyribonuclease RuvC